jgi:hypothetical protein
VVEENHEFEDTLDNREILSQKNKKTKKQKKPQQGQSSSGSVPGPGFNPQ